jgi:hypothetical protein
MHAAARYADAGWPVFPLQARGKRPLEAGGFHTATREASTIARWWATWPEANIGLVPGRAGLIVLDVDGPDGEGAARDWQLPPTLNCRTGRDGGGRHLYYRHPGGVIGNRRLAPRLDVRADAGYVILPPSVHPSGTPYRWDGSVTDIVPLPPHVTAYLQSAPADAGPRRIPLSVTLDSASVEPRRIEAYIARLGQRGEGERNSAAYQLAAWLQHDMALADAEAWPWLVHWNRGNTPPLAERELRAVLASAARTGRRAIGAGLAQERARPAVGRPTPALTRLQRSEQRLRHRRAFHE